MIYLDLPNINTGGTVEEQLAEIRSYIYKNNEQMNATLANLTTDKFWENTANAVSSAQSKDETPRLLSQYAKIRDLIIKTATEVTKTDEHYSMLMSGSYLAKSQFGEYLKKTSVEIDGESTGFTELYRYSTDLGSDYAELNSVKLDYENYIKRGLLDDTGATPIYGIELGLLKNTITVDGQEISTGEKYKTRITPNKWSFLRGSTEVASITEDAITFPKANITGGSIDIGNGAFKVTSAGVMTATAGTFSGTLAASSLRTAFNGYTNQKIVLNSNSIDFIYSSDLTDFSIAPNGICFYKNYNGVNSEMFDIKKYNIKNTDLSGVQFRLYNNYASFWAVDNDTQNVIAYIPPSILPGAGNYYGGAPGLHINTPIDFHYQNISNVVVKSMNIDGTLSANGAAGVTGHTIVKLGYYNANNELIEYWSDLYINDGIITGIVFH